MDVALVGVCEPKNAFLLLDTTPQPHASLANGVPKNFAKKVKKAPSQKPKELYLSIFESWENFKISN